MVRRMKATIIQVESVVTPSGNSGIPYSTGKWLGLGMKVVCTCSCGHKKMSLALEEVGQPSNAANMSSLEMANPNEDR
jgi:hypothetical protein